MFCDLNSTQLSWQATKTVVASCVLHEYVKSTAIYDTVMMGSIIVMLLAYKFLVSGDSLDLIPGPYLARWSSLYRPYLYLYGNGPQRLRNLHEKYGPIVRIGPAHVSISDLTATKQLYGVGNRYRKVGSSNPVVYFTADLIFATSLNSMMSSVHYTRGRNSRHCSRPKTRYCIVDFGLLLLHDSRRWESADSSLESIEQ